MTQISVHRGRRDPGGRIRGVRCRSRLEEESARQRESSSPPAGPEAQPIGDTVPVPMFIPLSASPDAAPPEAFPDPDTNPDLLRVDGGRARRRRPRDAAGAERARRHARVAEPGAHAPRRLGSCATGHQGRARGGGRGADTPGAPSGLDCRPFKPGVEVDVIREPSTWQPSGTTASAARASSSGSSTRASTGRPTP